MQNIAPAHPDLKYATGTTDRNMSCDLDATRQQAEFNRLAEVFIPAVHASPINEGGDFAKLCHIDEEDGVFFIAGAGQKMTYSTTAVHV